MSQFGSSSAFSRRHALALSGALAGALLAPGQISQALADSDTQAGPRDDDGDDDPGPLPVEDIENILEAKGSVNDSVLSIEIDRKDIDNVTLHGVPILPSFEINGTLAFQPLSNGQAFLNADMALKPSEINPFIDALLTNGLVFQAEHQHVYDFEPDVWFIHFRGKDDPRQLARAAHNALKVTSVPLPQQPPQNPTTPLDPNRLKSILHGYEVQVGDNGVITVFVARRNPVVIDGVDVEPQANIAHTIAFEPLQGSRSAVVPDFSLVASEINNVMRVMRALDWDIGCLYNQETDEHPQLYFSHQFKVGDAYALAAEIRRGLDRTDSA